ncbi:MAG: hypothetical protein ACTSRC_12295 [Candidatus Helarchaeota archaeon]
MGLLKSIASRLRSRAESRAEQAIIDKADDLVDSAVGKIGKVKLDVKGKMITDFADFEAKWKTAGRQPQKSVLYFLIAAHNASSDADKGEAMATLILPSNYLVENADSPSGFKINPEGEGWPIWDLWSDPITVKSYLGGEANEEYKLDKDGDIVLKVIGKAQKGREAALVITSADKDTEVTVSLKRNKKGQWKIFTMTSADVGKVEEDDF